MKQFTAVSTARGRSWFYDLYMRENSKPMLKLKVKKLDPRATVPTVANPGEDLAYDIYALNHVSLRPGEATRVQTGIAAMFDANERKYISPAGESSGDYGLLIRDRSSMAAKGIVTTGGVIDSGYRGEINVILTNLRLSRIRVLMNAIVSLLGSIFDLTIDGPVYEIKAGDKIAQMIPLPVLTGQGVEEVESLPEAARGANGFGSTGR